MCGQSTVISGRPFSHKEMHDLNEVLEHCKSGSQYKHGFCSNSTQCSSRADSFFRQSGDVSSRMDLFSPKIYCQCGLVSVSCFLTCSFDMFKYIFWVSLRSFWLIFDDVVLWRLKCCHLAVHCRVGKWPYFRRSYSLGVWRLLGSEHNEKLETKNWNIPVFLTCRYPLSLVMSEFWRVHEWSTGVFGLCLVASVWCLLPRFHSRPVQVEISLRTLIPLSPQWLTDLMR